MNIVVFVLCFLFFICRCRYTKEINLSLSKQKPLEIFISRNSNYQNFYEWIPSIAQVLSDLINSPNSWNMPK